MRVICTRHKNGSLKEVFTMIPSNKDYEEIFRAYCEDVYSKKIDLIVVNEKRFIALFSRSPEPKEIGLYNMSLFHPYQANYLKTPYGLKFSTGDPKKDIYLSAYSDQLHTQI
jgi:hypothetical protein